MASVFDVAAFIVGRLGTISPMKLQKLVYYTQAWSAVRDGGPAFPEPFEGWKNGPVCPLLYHEHAGADFVPIPYPRGDAASLPSHTVTTAEGVLCAYGKKAADWLSDLTHREGPWIASRTGLPPDARGNVTISIESMRAYYSAADSSEARIVISYGRPANRFAQFMKNMNDDEAAIVDELTELDLDPEVAKRSV